MRLSLRDTIGGLALLAWAAALSGCNPDPKVPTVDSCSALPIFDNYLEADAITLPLHFENRIGRSFHAEGVCISIDGRRIRQDGPDAIAAGFAAHRPLELRVMLRPDVPHQVNVAALFVGRGALEGYTFWVSSSHAIEPADPKPETLTVEFLERGKPDTRPEQRLIVQWTSSGTQPRRP